MKYIVFSSVLAVYASVGHGQSTDTTRTLPQVEIIEKRLEGLPFDAAARNIQVISRDDIAQLPVQTLAEVLTYAGGVDLRQRGPWGAQGDLTMSGSTFEQVLVLINGIPMRDPQTGHHQMNLPIDLNQIERIEVMKGSAARIYGANALAGAVNIITRAAGSDQVFIQSYAGSDLNTSNDREKEYVLTGQRLGIGARSADGKSGHQIDYSFFRTDGYRYNSTNTQHRISYMADFEGLGGKWNVIAGAADNQFGARSFYAHPYDLNAYERVRNGFTGLHYTRKAGAWTLRPIAYYRYNHDDYIFVRASPEIYRNNHFTTAAGAEMHASRTNKLGSFGMGYEARAEIIRSNNLGRHERYFHSIYVEQRIQWNSGATLTGGANVQVNSDYGFRVYPGLEWSNPLGNHLRLFANAGSGSRLPTYTDLYYSDRANIGNANLRPEWAWNAEAGLRKTGDRLRAQVSGFTRQAQDFIDFVRENDTLRWQPQNFKQVTIYGMEANATYRFEKTEVAIRPVLLHVQYTYLAGEVGRGELFNKYALDHLTHQIIARFSAQTTARILHTFSVRYLERFNGQQYAIMDYRIRGQWDHWAVFADATNLLDRQFTESGFVPMPGRWFRLGVEFRL